ncbi:unnamed protein product [Sphagnum jensenii]|uniref:Glycosyltransferase RgtA/B/C/D-like domain-containing protein n=1 Tax=Sphagnum jensenii TaxID=128206 RepID=A0ABP0V6Z4_9BRYO
MEYKGDERVMVNFAFNLQSAPQFPWIGMETSTGIANPGLSVWMFQAPTRVFGITTPTGLDRWVQCFNIFALVLLFFLIAHYVPRGEQEVWIWALILMCFNPMAILFSRKIWAQCVLVPFTVCFLGAWWRRDRNWGALLWGLSGLLLGQIHISGLFLTLALFLWTATFRRQGVRWKAWLIGSAIGMIGVVQWLRLVHGQKNQKFDWHHFISIQYWRYWISDSVGIDLNYSLQSFAFNDFWKSPFFGDRPTYLVGALHVLLYAFIIILICLMLFKVIRERQKWLEVLKGSYSDTHFLLSAVLLGYGVLITASGSLVKHHYLIVAYPMLWVWLAQISFTHLKRPRQWLFAVALAQALISVGFLTYIHQNHGAPGDSDYGVTYGAQRAAGTDE